MSRASLILNEARSFVPRLPSAGHRVETPEAVLKLRPKPTASATERSLHRLATAPSKSLEKRVNDLRSQVLEIKDQDAHFRPYRNKLIRALGGQPPKPSEERPIISYDQWRAREIAKSDAAAAKYIQLLHSERKS